jgi:hypothetical protein
MSDRVALAVFTDGRTDLLRSTLASLDARVTMPDGGCWRLMLDDSGDYDIGRALDAEHGERFTILHSPFRRGFGGTIRNAWRVLAERLDCEFVLHLEDDFTFQRDVDVREMIRVLRARPTLVQLALRRQAWNAAEVAAGGVIEQHPGDYADCSLDGLRWLEHRRFFTTNPSIYRRELCALGWPGGRQSEGRFAHALLADPLVRFGFFGARDDDPWVLHKGAERAGTGY